MNKQGKNISLGLFIFIGSVLLLSWTCFATNSLNVEIHGIRLEAYNGNEEGEMTVYERGKIFLPILDGWDERVILELSNIISHNGEIDFQAIKVESSNFNYNKLGTIKVKSIHSDETGFVLDGEITLGTSMPEGLRYRSFKLEPFKVNVTDGFGSELIANVPTDDPIIIEKTIAFTTTKMTFRDDENTKSLYWTDGTMKIIGPVGDALNNPEVQVNFIEVDSRGDFRGFDTDLYKQIFRVKGIDFTLLTMYWDMAKNIKFTGYGTIPSLANAKISIYSLVFDSTTGNVNELILVNNDPVTRVIMGWEIELFTLILKNDVFSIKANIRIPKELKDLLPGLGGRSIRINEWMLTSAGEVRKFSIMVPYQEELPLEKGYTLLVHDLIVNLENQSLKDYTLTLPFDLAGIFFPDKKKPYLPVSDVSILSDGRLDYGKVRINQSLVPILEWIQSQNN